MNVEEFMTHSDKYYGRNYGFNTKRTSSLYDYCKDYNEIPWKYAKTVAADDRISYYQVLYALSEITGKFRYQTITAFIEKLKDFQSIFYEDEFGRKYIPFSEYKEYAHANKGTFKLKNVKNKEENTWLLRL